MQSIIECAWEDRSLLEDIKTQEVIREVINQLDSGKLRVASPTDSLWQVNEWVKKAVVLYFPIQKMRTLEAGPMELQDKMPQKRGYKENDLLGGIDPYSSSKAAAELIIQTYINSFLSSK